MSPTPDIISLLKELLRLEQWATPGEWIAPDLPGRLVTSDGRTVADMRYRNGVHDGAFIAAAQKHLPSIAQALLRMHAELQLIKDHCQNSKGPPSKTYIIQHCTDALPPSP